jgi:hypothetical protein
MFREQKPRLLLACANPHGGALAESAAGEFARAVLALGPTGPPSADALGVQSLLAILDAHKKTPPGLAAAGGVRHITSYSPRAEMNALLKPSGPEAL